MNNTSYIIMEYKNIYIVYHKTCYILDYTENSEILCRRWCF